MSFDVDPSGMARGAGSATEQLNTVPAQMQFAERLGWQPAIWGALLLLVAAAFVPRRAAPAATIEWEIAGVCALVGLLLLGYEIRRRRNRTVLVRDGGQIAVYRKGRLDLVLAREEIRQGVKPGLILMLKVGVPLAVCGAGLCGVALTGLMRNPKHDSDSLLILVSGLACWASLTSAAWVQFRYVHLRVPVRGSKLMAEETVLLSPAQGEELFG